MNSDRKSKSLLISLLMPAKGVRMQMINVDALADAAVAVAFDANAFLFSI